MMFRFVPKMGGAHVHVAVSSAPAAEQTFAKLGDLTVSAGEEWDAFKRLLSGNIEGDYTEIADGAITVNVVSGEDA